MTNPSGFAAQSPARPPPASAAPARLPGLDGLRGVSILIVMVGHWLLLNYAASPVRQWLPSGAMGVKIFFVLSGFLITTLALDERDRTGRLDLPRFYGRRALRIMPPLAAFLAVMALFQAAGKIQIPGRDWIGVATFTTNFSPAHSLLGHLWSLAVEEQFYLFFPLMLALWGVRPTAALGLLGVVVLPALRCRSGLPLPGTHYDLNAIAWDWPADFIAWGCLLAIGSRAPRVRPFLEMLRRPWCAALAAVVIVPCEIHHNLVFIDLVVGPALAVIVWWSTRRSRTLAGRVLNAWPLVTLGRMSYSIYLWQQCFLLNPASSLLTTFPFSFGFAIAAGALSHRLTERPFNRFRRRLEAKRD